MLVLGGVALAGPIDVSCITARITVFALACVSMCLNKALPFTIQARYMNAMHNFASLLNGSI